MKIIKKYPGGFTLRDEREDGRTYLYLFDPSGTGIVQVCDKEDAAKLADLLNDRDQMHNMLDYYDQACGTSECPYIKKIKDILEEK